MSKNWQRNLREQGKWESSGMRIKSPDWSVGNTAATGMSRQEISRGNVSLLRKNKKHNGLTNSRKFSTDEHQKRISRYYERMQTPHTSSRSAEVSTATLPVLLVLVTSCSKSRLVSGRDVLCLRRLTTFL